MENKYTSPKLSKLLFDNGCKLKSRKAYNLMPDGGFYDNLVNVHSFSKSIIKDRLVLTYDILNDICVKYAREFFGDIRRGEYTREVLALLQRNQKQEAEDYIWEHTIFNKSNKKQD